jgi:D-amino-acid dehydrogenase
MKNDSHAIIVGAGIAGLTAAYFLSRTGMAVTVIDKGSGKDNCSYGNAGMIVPSHIVPLASPGIISQGLRWMLKAESPFYIKPRLNRELLSWGWKFKQTSTQEHVEESAPVLRDLLMRNRSLLVDFEEEEALDFGFRKNGLFMLCKTERGLEEEIEVAEKAKALGIPVEVLSAEEVRQMEPNIRMDIIGATYFPKDAHLHPGQLMSKLKALLQKRGVLFKLNTEITDIKEKCAGDIEVIASSGQKFPGSHVILCLGAWMPILMNKIGLNLPLQAGKGYSITIQKPKNHPQICALLTEAKVSMTPMAGQLRFGGTMEIVGRDRSVTPAKISALKKSVVQYFPEYSMGNLNKQEVWVGLRPCSPDGLPYVGKINSYTNLYVSTGHAMIGMSLSFASGELISQLILDVQSDLSHSLIDPNRYM